MDFIVPKLYHSTMTKVAILIPTMNRPDFILRQFEFYELMNSPHPIYVLDSSNPENADKLKKEIKKFKKLSIIYQWAPPGKDCLYQLLPQVKEKYCIQMGDDDLLIPSTMSECADFLEKNPDYATCAGKQINFSFQKKNYNKPYGIIERQTLPHGRSLEDDNMLARVKEFWFDLKINNSEVSIRNVAFICFVVRSVELEKSIRNVTKYFSLTEHILEFLSTSILVISGKFKVLDKLGYVMQKSSNRYSFTHSLTVDVVTDPNMSSQWAIAHKEFAEIIREKGYTEEEGLKIAKWIFVLYLARQFTLETDWPPVTQTIGHFKSTPTRPTSARLGRGLFKKARYFVSRWPLLESIYYKYHPTNDATRPESKYFNDFKVVKDFLEKNHND
ncbi:MAG: hypothetical protein A2651_00325 [Candidatus Yanofskybacteria bacterium RIFCSPHIGHO2_01_FULL_42_12]|uniref:Glycosyltransferase 2-like domain-containing protein n=1 Tax=Candidatus Yanofskybacteria bacterium RIFCSPLOWO2_01_FULL_42_49 TaxID=1802694 RepID=A0A1F8GBP6_9BACT|nr:MAG: hypothetical protein A2651_00325 [Candidatus Yanofskybacteria bacterium RIFCSPHIGHO2_01_FULL_42_12]OGN22148.1 MAG: hypothetical protein A2918_03245 [Candidatus Yanofskybacteria bacterium RIFCSPLOWO2_01_FULL_42_49]